MYLSNYLSIYIYLSAYLKTKLFCETSSMFELDNIKNAAILRDFLNFWTWRRQKRSYSVRPPQVFKLTTSKTKQFCETSFKNGKLSAELTAFDGLVPMRFAIFPVDVSKLLRLPLKKGCQVIRRAAPVTQNHLSKPEDLMLQNAIFLRKSLSRICLLHTAPATRNASFQTVFKCPTPAIVFRLPSFLKVLQNLHALLTFHKVHNPLRLPRKTTSEQPKVLRALHFLHFWLGHVLRATTACTFSTCRLPKVVRHCGALYILTCKCASRHNGVHFSSLISPHGSAPAPLASLLFDPPEPQIIGKTQWIATFRPFRAPASSFFALFLFSDSHHLCFSICPYSRKFDF